MVARWRQVGAILTCACLAAALVGDEARSSAAQPEPQTAALGVEAMLDAVNASRRERGMRALTADRRLTQAAATQARYLARTRRLDHRGPDGSNVGQRVRRAGYDWSLVAENLASSASSSPRTVVQLWMNSRAHRRNMLDGRVTQMGGAHVGTVWVLVMARPRR